MTKAFIDTNVVLDHALDRSFVHINIENDFRGKTRFVYAEKY